MSDVTMIGLGAMGSALARALLNAGHEITVWNRSPQRMEPIVALGAAGAASVSEALRASPVILVCIDHYGATRRLLEDDGAAPHLAGRTLVQMSTGTPKEARDAEAWVTDLGGAYLDIAIEAYPEGIGAPDGRLLIAGRQESFTRAEAFLKCFAGDLRYLGDNIGAAATLDLASLVQSLGNYVAIAHANRLCEAEGVGVDLFASLHPEGDRARQLAEIVHAGDYKLASLHPGASIRVWEEVVQRLQSQADDRQMNRELPDFLSGIFKRAIAAGIGEEDLAALIKVLRA